MCVCVYVFSAFFEEIFNSTWFLQLMTFNKKKTI